MSIEAMKQALVALENIGCWLTTIGQKGLRDYEADAMEALRQAIEEAEKQEPLILDRGCYERGCVAYDERDGDGVNISAERVDETAKGEHEPVAFVTGYFGGYLTIAAFDPTLILPDGLVLYRAPPKREWVGLTDEEREQFRNLGFVGVLVVENKLKEKNSV